MNILPFLVRGKEFAVDISAVYEAGILPNICFVPQSRPPAAGIIQLRGELVPVWNTCLFAGQSVVFLRDCPHYLEIGVQGKKIALPVEKVGRAVEFDPLWSEQNFYGLRIFHRK